MARGRKAREVLTHAPAYPAERLCVAVLGEIRGKGSKRSVIRRGQVYLVDSDPRSRPYQLLVESAIALVRPPELWEGPVWVTVRCWHRRPEYHWKPVNSVRPCPVLRQGLPWFPTTTPDSDKIARLVLDALTGYVYRDDRQCGGGLTVLRDWTRRKDGREWLEIHAGRGRSPWIRRRTSGK